MQPKKRKIKLEMPKDPSGKYSNMVMISHNKNEMFFDFIQTFPHDPRAKVQQRIVMTPTHAKLFLQALQDNIERFETNFGEVTVPKRPASLADQLFGGIQSNINEEEDEDNDEQSE
ncbi:MAG: hypothetical protein Phog2KO_32890 [Phototrophicaceae bacterium]